MYRGFKKATFTQMNEWIELELLVPLNDAFWALVKLLCFLFAGPSFWDLLAAWFHLLELHLDFLAAITARERRDSIQISQISCGGYGGQAPVDLNWANNTEFRIFRRTAFKSAERVHSDSDHRATSMETFQPFRPFSNHRRALNLHLVNSI